MDDLNFLEEFRSGNRGRLIVSLAAKDATITADELTEILLGNYADKLGYRRAMRHPNAPAELIDRLAKDGEMLHVKCKVYDWPEASPEEIRAGALWMVENNAGDSFTASYYASHSNTMPDILTYLYYNFDDDGYLWEALLANPNTPDDLLLKIQNRQSKSQRITELNHKILELVKQVDDLR